LEGRKVQKVGYSTLTVSLPHVWVKQHNIHPGDLVFLKSEPEGTLKVLPSHIAQKAKVEEYIINADACDEKGMLERIIVGSYILGRDVIQVKSHRLHTDHVSEVRNIVRRLIGIGILESTPQKMLLQCSIDPTKFQFDMLIRRLSVIASTILSEALRALLENNNAVAEDAINREEEADAIYYLAVRLLLAAQQNTDIAEQLGITDILLIPASRLILQNLELIADYSKDIAKQVIELGVYRNKLSKTDIEHIYNIGETAQTICQKAVDSVFSRNFRIANEMLEMHNVVEMECGKLLGDLPVIPYVRSTIFDLHRIADMGTTIAHLAINLALEEPDKYVKDILQVIKHKRRLP
jgi:phosphate uptake regulator